MSLFFESFDFSLFESPFIFLLTLLYVGGAPGEHQVVELGELVRCGSDCLFASSSGSDATIECSQRSLASG